MNPVRPVPARSKNCIELYMDELNKYVEQFKLLAKDEDIDLNEKQLKKVLRKYPIPEIERAYDACARFGIRAIWQTL